MSSNFASKKFAIINSQNTARTLKLVERPVPIIKRRHEKADGNHQVKQDRSSTLTPPLEPSQTPLTDQSSASETSLSLNMSSRNTSASSHTYRMNLNVDQSGFSPAPEYVSLTTSSSSVVGGGGSSTESTSSEIDPSAMVDDSRAHSDKALLLDNSETNDDQLLLSDPPIHQHAHEVASCIQPSSSSAVGDASKVSRSISSLSDKPVTTVSGDFKPTSPKITADEDFSVAEFFALSKGPVSLNDFHVGGEKVSLKSRQLATPTSAGSRSMRPPLTNAVSPSFTTLPHSVHQFCVHSDLPLLPLQLQILSRKIHAHPSPKVIPSEGDPQKVPTERENGLEVLGVTLPIETDPMKLLWTPAPGKLALYPSTVQRLLTSQRDIANDTEEDLHEIKQDKPVTIEEDEHLMEVKQLQERILLETSNNLNRDPLDGEGGRISEEPDEEVVEEKQDRCDTVDSHAQYLFIMNEVTWQRDQLLQYHKNKMEASSAIQHGDRETDEDTIASESTTGSQFDSSSIFSTAKMMRKSVLKGATRKGTTATAGGKLHRPIKRTKSAIARSQYFRQEVSKPPRSLQRSVSHPSLLSDQLVREDDHKLQVDYNPSRIMLRRTNSVPDVVYFDKLFKAKGDNYSDPQKWAESVWDDWFYEVLAEVRAAIADLEKGRTPYFKWQSCVNIAKTSHEPKQKKSNAKLSKLQTTTKSSQSPLTELELATIPHLSGIDLQSCVERIEEITAEMESSDNLQTKATLLSERGPLYRKTGRLCESMSDLTESISLSPRLAPPHWDRHLLSLIQGNEKRALEDVTLLLKKDQNNVLGYISKGALLAKIGRFSDAIYNYTKAIWLDGSNPKLYFIRAELREKKGETEAAVGDYATVVSLDPLNEEALVRQAVHKFNRKLWGNTAQLLTTLLGINRNRTEAWLLRSQAHLHMDKHDLALQDLSAAIHLNPNNAKLYYQRGCLVRSRDPVRALQDFSITLLLGASDSACALAYLHRGVVYCQLKSLDEALSDFRTAVQLDPSLASAHTNAGLIVMSHNKSPSDAIKYFTAGILADPTYIRALLCRAEAYTKMEEFDKAVVDWTRATHYFPDNPSYHLNRGKVFLKMKDYSSSLFCIKTASKLEGGVGSSPTQQALVYAFLGDHDKAITKLQAVVNKGRKSADLFTVLGKVQLRARMFSDAATSFANAIDHICFTDPYLSSNANKKATTELHYMRGRSLLGAGNFKTAVEEFSQVTSVTPSNAWAHYYHGLALLKSGSSKGMVSINRALMLNPTLTEGFLTRAAFYGKVGRFSKAILNCTEAIRLQPKSSRAYLCRGVLRHKMGYEEPAITDLSEAIRLTPTLSAIALFNRAICYQAIEDTNNAIKDYSTIYLMEGTNSYLYQVLINRGLLYLYIKDYRNALIDFTEASEIQSDDSSLWQSIAFCHHKLGQLNESVQCYSKAISVDPSFIEAFIGRGNAYTEFLSAEGNQKARSDYNHVIRSTHECLAAQLNLALLLQCEGKHMLAWENLTELLELHKDYVPALEARAIISLQNMNTFGSLLDINRAIQLQPSAGLYVERGVVYQYMKDVYNAVKDFEKAISMDPHLSIAYYNMGNILLQQKLYRQAVDRYSKAIDLSDEDSNRDEALVNRGICFVAIGDDAKAFSDFDSAIEANPYAAHGYFNRANLFKKNGNLSAAEEDYRKALSLYPNDPVSLDYHGYTLGLLGHSEESRMQFFKAVEIV